MGIIEGWVGILRLLGEVRTFLGEGTKGVVCHPSPDWVLNESASHTHTRNYNEGKRVWCDQTTNDMYIWANNRRHEVGSNTLNSSYSPLGMLWAAGRCLPWQLW